MRGSLELLVTFMVQMIILVDPVAGAPVLLAITPDNTRAERRAMALRGCLVACLVICFFYSGRAVAVGILRDSNRGCSDLWRGVVVCNRHGNALRTHHWYRNQPS